MQQDGVKSPQSDRESLKELCDLCLLIIGRDRSDSVARSFKNCTADSLIGPKVSKAIGCKAYDPDNATYTWLVFMDSAISAAAPAEDAEAEM